MQVVYLEVIKKLRLKVEDWWSESEKGGIGNHKQCVNQGNSYCDNNSLTLPENNDRKFRISAMKFAHSLGKESRVFSH